MTATLIDDRLGSLRLDITAKFFRALGDPSRLKILDLLLDSEKNVGELVERLGSSQGRVSNHLACLKQCGFVKCRRDNKFIYYSISSDENRRLLNLAKSIISRNAEQIWACTRVGPEGEDEANGQV